MSKLKTVCAVVLSVLLAACGSGGGGGGSSSSAPPPGPTVSTLSFPVESTIVTLATTSSSYTVYATDAKGNGDLLTVSYAPGPSIYNSKIYSSALPTFMQTELLKVNGVTSSTSSVQVFYSTGPFLVWGSVNGTSGQNTMQVKQQTYLPATAKIGATGSIYSGNNYISNSTLFPDAQSVTWSLEADTADTAWLCINIINVPSLFAELTTIESDCFRINQSGTILGFKVDMTIPTNCGAYTCDKTTLRYR